MVTFASFFGPKASSSIKPNLHSHRRSVAGSLRLLSAEISLPLPSLLSSGSDRISYSEGLEQGTAKSASSEGKKSMTRTKARELMFWNGRLYEVPLGVVLVYVSSDSIDESDRGVIR